MNFQMEETLINAAKNFFSQKYLENASFHSISDIDYYEAKSPLICSLLKSEPTLLSKPIISDIFLNFLQRIRKIEDRNLQKKLMYKINMFLMYQTRLALTEKRYFNYETKKMIELDVKKIKEASKKSTLYNVDLLNQINRPEKPRFKETCVDIVSEDCCDICIKMQEKSKEKWALLNMASAKDPNGGWLTGAWAQEESITKRGNYIQQLYANKDKYYPIGEFEGIHSAEVAIFRANENEGYKFLDEVKYIDCIAVAAYDLNKGHKDFPSFWLESNREQKFLQNTSKKIEVILKIAIDQQVDNLVLGPLGCGAFKNDPAIVSEAFLKAIKKYAGCFNYIIFSILGNKTDNNYVSFKKTFGAAFNLDILKLKVCGRNDCSDKSELHQLTCYHTVKCKYGARCDYFGDEVHRSEYNHPPRCQIDCEDQNFKHRDSYWHPPNCRDGKFCKSLSESHRNSFFHPKKECKFGGICNEIHLEEHKIEFSHPNLRCGKVDCDEKSLNHYKNMLHLEKLCENCPYFKEKFPLSTNPEIKSDYMKSFLNHCRMTYIHDFLLPCPDFEKCHPEIKKCYYDDQSCNFSHLCLVNNLNKKCQNEKDADHFNKYVHLPEPLYFQFYFLLRKQYQILKYDKSEATCSEKGCTNRESNHILKLLHKQRIPQSQFVVLQFDYIYDFRIALSFYDCGQYPLCKNFERCSFQDVGEKSKGDCEKYSHLCFKGIKCDKIEDSMHSKSFLHINESIFLKFKNEFERLMGKISSSDNRSVNPAATLNKDFSEGKNINTTGIKTENFKQRPNQSSGENIIPENIKPSKNTENKEIENTPQDDKKKSNEMIGRGEVENYNDIGALKLKKGDLSKTQSNKDHPTVTSKNESTLEFYESYNNIILPCIAHEEVELNEEEISRIEKSLKNLGFKNNDIPLDRQELRNYINGPVYVEIKYEQEEQGLDILNFIFFRRSFSVYQWQAHVIYYKALLLMDKKTQAEISTKFTKIQPLYQGQFQEILELYFARKIFLLKFTSKSLFERLVDENLNTKITQIEISVNKFKDDFKIWENIKVVIDQIKFSPSLDCLFQKMDIDNFFNISYVRQPSSKGSLVLEIDPFIKNHPNTLLFDNLPSVILQKKIKSFLALHKNTYSCFTNLNTILRKKSEKCEIIKNETNRSIEECFKDILKEICFILPENIPLYYIKNITMEGNLYKMFYSKKDHLDFINKTANEEQLTISLEANPLYKKQDIQKYSFRLNKSDNCLLLPIMQKKIDQFMVKFTMKGHGLRLAFLNSMDKINKGCLLEFNLLEDTVLNVTTIGREEILSKSGKGIPNWDQKKKDKMVFKLMFTKFNGNYEVGVEIKNGRKDYSNIFKQNLVIDLIQYLGLSTTQPVALVYKLEIR